MIYQDKDWQDKIFVSAIIEEMIWEKIETENVALKRGVPGVQIRNCEFAILRVID